MRFFSSTTATLLAATLAFAAAGGMTPAANDGDHRLEDAAGTAVVAALRNQFEGRDVEFQLDAMDAERANMRDLALSGDGRIRIDRAGGWLPVRFEALYDRATGTVLSPAITLDRNPDAAPATPTAGLGDAVDRALASEFAWQDVAFELDEAWRTGGDDRYAVVDGTGVARFEGEGSAEVRLQAVYDLVDEAWIHVGYSLGGEPAPPAPAFATR